MKEIENEDNFAEEVAKNSSSVLVMFSKDKSPLCQKTEAVLASVERDCPQLKMIKIDVDKSSSIASRYMVTTPPAIIAFKAGRPKEKIMGLVSKREIERLIERLL